MIKLAHRFIFTERCNAECSHCFNASHRESRSLNFYEFTRWLADNEAALENCRLKIMGGEPTLHEAFKLMTEHALRRYSSVTVFTNGLKPEQLHSRIMDEAHRNYRLHFIINGSTSNLDDTWYYTHERLCFHIVVPQKNSDLMFNRIRKMSQMPHAKFMISPDTQVNIFTQLDYRDTYINFWKQFYKYMRGRVTIDHCIPNCFWTQNMIDDMQILLDHPIHTEPLQCCDRSLGLIDTEWNLYYCNQTRIRLGNVKGKTVEEIEKMLQAAPRKKLQSIGDTCFGCPSKTTCKAGCFYKHTQERNTDASI